MTTQPPEFPAVLALEGHEELIYLADETSWRQEADGLQLIPEQDRLIDARGALFAPSVAGGGALRALGETMSLDEFGDRVRRHLFAQADTCITKAGFGDFAQGMAMVASCQQ